MPPKSIPTCRWSRRPWRAACTATATPRRASASAGWPTPWSASASSRATGWRRWPGTATATSSSTTPSPASAPSATPSTRACSPSRSPTSPTTPRTRRCSSTLTFLPLVEKLKPALKTIKTYVLMTDREHMPANGQHAAACCATRACWPKCRRHSTWPEFDENAACALCYTSGTTGEPKGVLYSNRSMLLHTFFLIATRPDLFAHNRTILPVVPLFHANAWSLPYVTPLTGCPIILPGAKLDGPTLYDLMESEGVEAGWGVPTVWLGLLEEFKKRGRKPKKLDADPERRLGRAAGHDRHLHARLRHRGDARLGHDRDEPGRHADAVPPRGARQAADGARRPFRQAGPAHVRRRPQDHRREGQPRAAGRRRPRASCSCAAPPSCRATSTTRRPPPSRSTAKAGSAPATSPRSRPTAGC